MNRPYPSREEILSKFDYNPSTAQLIHRSGRYAGKIAGGFSNSGARYILWNLIQKIPRSHIIWFLEKGEWPPADKKVLHKNKDSIDDKIDNLKLANFVNNSKPWYHRGKPLSAEDRAHFDSLCKKKKKRTFKNLEKSRRRQGISDDEFFGRNRKKTIETKLPTGASVYDNKRK